MKIEKIKTKYGYWKLQCPFCDYQAFDRPITKVSPDPLRDLKRHITNEAKNEAFFDAISPDETDDTQMRHLNYYREHTDEKPEKKTKVKRQYDSDMSL